MPDTVGTPGGGPAGVGRGLIRHFCTSRLFCAGPQLELKAAWLPLPRATFEDPALAYAVIPWPEQVPDPKEEPSVDGTSLIELARATHTLNEAMRQLISIWPDADGPIRQQGLPEAREALGAATAAFNTAARQCRLAHRMPLSVFDVTWLPHNLRNALEFQSVPSTLTAELSRTWGTDAARAFRDAYDMAVRGDTDAGRLDELAAIRAPPATAAEVHPDAPPLRLDVFVCYTWADKTRGARDIYEFVVRRGATAWLDEEQRPADASLDEQIAAAIGTARTIVACLSREMITRGGYALRELLFALSSAPERTILARLDRSPVPSTLRELRTVDWFEKDGTARLGRELDDAAEHETPHAISTLWVPEGPLRQALVALVQRAPLPPRNFNAPDRQQQLATRAALSEHVRAVWDLFEASDWKAISERVQHVENAQLLPSLSSTAVHDEPTLLGPAVRLRFTRFVAELQSINDGDGNEHNRSAFRLIDELLSIDPAIFSPAPALGWTAEDCRVSVRDCLDACAYAEEWQRGWSPDMLARMCGIPLKAAADLEPRMASLAALLGDRMLALRAFEDRDVPDVSESWADMWASLFETLRHKLNPAGHPLTAAYFAQLRTIITDQALGKVAVAMADGATEALRTAVPVREELIDDHPQGRTRFVVRCYRALPSKFASFAMAHDSVLDDLVTHPDTTDLTILISTFALPPASDRVSKYETTLNVLPHPRPGAAPELANLGPMLMPQMLSVREQAQAGELLKGDVIYQEM